MFQKTAASEKGDCRKTNILEYALFHFAVTIIFEKVQILNPRRQIPAHPKANPFGGGLFLSDGRHHGPA